MANFMRDDGRGKWEVDRIDGSQVEWRRREAVAGEASIDGGSGWVVDISVDGAPPETQPDFTAGVPDHRQELEIRVPHIKARQCK